jgi:putative hydrolase of the HAD superfamily
MQEKSIIKTVIFDIDNTLFNFTSANRHALDAAAEYTRGHFGWTKEAFDSKYAEMQKKILDHQGQSGSCRNRMLRFQNMLEADHLPLSPHAVALYDLYWNALLSGITPFEDAKETMLVLKQKGLRIGCCTDMTAYMQFRKLEKLGLTPFIDFVVSSEEAGAEKPDPAIFRLCTEKSGAAAEECLFVGDHPEKDYGGAVASGMHALLLNPGGTGHEGILFTFLPDSSKPAGSLRPAGGNSSSSVMCIRELRQVIDYLDALTS